MGSSSAGHSNKLKPQQLKSLHSMLPSQRDKNISRHFSNLGPGAGSKNIFLLFSHAQSGKNDTTICSQDVLSFCRKKIKRDISGPSPKLKKFTSVVTVPYDRQRYAMGKTMSFDDQFKILSSSKELNRIYF